MDSGHPQITWLCGSSIHFAVPSSSGISQGVGWIGAIVNQPYDQFCLKQIQRTRAGHIFWSKGIIFSNISYLSVCTLAPLLPLVFVHTTSPQPYTCELRLAVPYALNGSSPSSLMLRSFPNMDHGSVWREWTHQHPPTPQNPMVDQQTSYWIEMINLW